MSKRFVIRMNGANPEVIAVPPGYDVDTAPRRVRTLDLSAGPMLARDRYQTVTVPAWTHPYPVGIPRENKIRLYAWESARADGAFLAREWTLQAGDQAYLNQMALRRFSSPILQWVNSPSPGRWIYGFSWTFDFPTSTTMRILFHNYFNNPIEVTVGTFWAN